MTTRFDKTCITCQRLMPDIWFRRNAYNLTDYNAALKAECSECFSRRLSIIWNLPMKDNPDYPTDVGVHR